MTQCLDHRGPDSRGEYVNSQVSLGHQRLAIIDLSDKGEQPMEAEKEYAIVYNGEIYNFEHIRKELREKGYNLTSETDTEVVLYAYVEWGPRCVERFNGMFAFTIYDGREDELFLARDHLGIKPLFYYEDNGKFIFSSEIEPLLLHDINFSPNRQLIRDFLLYSITDHTNQSFFHPISKLPKGSYGIYDLTDNEFEIHSWWENEFTGDFDGTYAEAKDHLKQLLEQSVKRRLMSDVPVGTCLSGGIDSSSVASIIGNTRGQNEIETFSAVFPGFEFDESEYIESVCDENSLVNHQTTPSAQEFSEDISDLIRTIGQPIPGPGPYSQYQVFKLANEQDVTVLLDGQGADELFAGYHLFHGFHIGGLLKDYHVVSALRELRGLISGGHYKIGLLSIGLVLAPDIILDLYFMRKSNVSKELLNDESLQTGYIKSFSSNDSLHEALTFYLDHRLEHLLTWEDRNSMAHSRESRVPFLDKDVLNFVFSLPEEYIVSDGKTKTILRDAMTGIVPEKILERRDKIGYGTPEKTWLAEKPLQKILQRWFFETTPRCAEFIDVQKTRNEMLEYWERQEGSTKLIWKSLFLEAWLREYWDKNRNIKSEFTDQKT
jgi:asparagine synthase (glutamine-hydrolysing)